MSIIKLPSGAQIEIRGLRGKEGRLLSDKDAIKSGTFLDKILSACTVGVVDPGPYETVSAAPLVTGGPSRQVLDWAKVLIGDRFVALIQIRVLSLGETFEFKLQCSSDGCRKRFEQEISLLQDLEVKELADEDRLQFSSGNDFVHTDANGKLIHYKLPVGKDEVIAAKAAQSIDGAFMAALLQRISSIEGEDIPRRYLEECDFSNLLRLLEAFDEHSCGVKTTIEIECPHCGNLEDIELPFGRGFFVPKLGKKA